MGTRCRSCQAEIVWARTVNGKPMPLDAAAVSVFVVEEGVARMVKGHVSHFATCPNGPAHRKAARQDDPPPGGLPSEG